jgi:hypothetical protein
MRPITPARQTGNQRHTLIAGNRRRAGGLRQTCNPPDVAAAAQVHQAMVAALARISDFTRNRR